MIILRDKLFTLPDSRKGIGWVNDKNGKLDSEKYFRAAKKAADRAESRGLSDEVIVKKAKFAAGKEALKDNSRKPTIDAIKYGGAAYLGSKLVPKGLIELSANRGADSLGQVGQLLRETAAGRRVVESAKKHAPKINKHAGKIGIAAALVGAGKHYNKVSGKVNSAVVGAEVNTKDRIRKRDKKK